MAKVHSSLATTELHNPKGIGVESATLEVLTISASLGAVSASASIVPHTTDAFNLGSDTQRWNNITAAGNISSSTTSTGSFGRLELAGNADIDGTLTIAGGTTTLGDSDSDTVVISADLASNLIPDADNTRDIGSVAASWRNIHLDGTGSFKNTIISNKEYFSDAGGEHISGDGTDLTIASGQDINLTATTDINIPANVGLTFGDDAEKIEGDGTDLTITGNNINLTATADVNIPSGVGLTFATTEKIESDGTDLSFTVGANGDINIPANIGLTFGNDGEKIEGDGTDLTISGNIIKVDSGMLSGSATSTGSFGRLMATSITASVVDVDAATLKVGGSEVNKTLVQNLRNTFSTTTVQSSPELTDVSIISGSSVSTGSFAYGLVKSKLHFSDIGGEIISGDGTDLTLNSGADINLTATSDVNIPTDVGITFGDDGEKIEGDGTDLTIAASNDLNLTATTDINIPANVGLTFGDDAEKIEGDGTDLTIAGNNINLTAVADVIIPTNVGLHFTDANEKIESDGTDFTFNSGNDINLTATTDVNIPSGVGLTFGNDGEKIEGDGTDLTIASSGDLTLSSTGNTVIETVTLNNGNVTIPGDLTVTGNRLEAQVGSLQVADHTITVGSGSATSALMEAGGIDWGISGSIANLRYQHATTSLTSSVFLAAPKLTVDTITLDAAEIDASGALTIDTGGDLTLDATGDVNVPANIGMTFGNDGEKIEGDGTDLTIASSAKLNLTATSDVHIPQNVGLVFDANASEKIESNDTDLTINSGADINLTATSDVNVPANVGLTFGDDGEKIEGDGTDLTIASSAKLNLTATSDVHIPQNVGLVFDANASEKIESNDTDLTINSGADINLTATTDINIPADVGLTFGNDAEKIEGDGTDLTIAGNNINLTAVADVKVPANVGIMLGTHEKIESDDTDLTITVGSGGDINIPANIGMTFGDDGEKIEGDGTDLTISANILKLDSGLTSGSVASTGSFGRVQTTTLTGTLQTATQGVIDHDSLANFVADEHINHTSVSVIAGDGLTGGGTIAANRTINVVGGDGITANADDVAITAAQTTITSVANTSLKIGRATDDEYIDFGTDGVIKVALGNVEEFRFAAGGTFHADADVIAFSSTVASDEKLKTNIEDINYGLADVIKLQGRRFDWIREDRGNDIGLVAQEVQEVIPEVVKEVDGLDGKDPHLTVDYAKLTSVLIEAVKDLKTEIEDIKKKCDCLN